MRKEFKDLIPGPKDQAEVMLHDSIKSCIIEEYQARCIDYTEEEIEEIALDDRIWDLMEEMADTIGEIVTEKRGEF